MDDSACTLGHVDRLPTYDELEALFLASCPGAQVEVLELRAGQGIRIPPGWWHKVISDGHSEAINFWANQNIPYFCRRPELFEHERVVDFRPIYDEQVWISTEGGGHRDTVANFLGAQRPGEFFLTVDDFAPTRENQKVRSLLAKQVQPPPEFGRVSCRWHIWMTSHSHRSGWHFDEEANLNYLLTGRKTFYLAPPVG